MGELEKHRRYQANLAIYRDGGLCAYHYIVLSISRPFAHVHHVYGRGVKIDDWREEYTQQLCLCLDCHEVFRPLRYHRNPPELIEDILRIANTTPINPRFKHPEEESN